VPKNRVRELLLAVNRHWAPSKNGYYFAKSIAEETIAHRTQLVPLLELLESDSRFTILYHDESQFRVYPADQESHIQPTSHTDMSEHEKALQYNPHLKTNVGPGYQVCTVISVDDACVVARDRPGHENDAYREPVGWIDSTIEVAKDDHHSFLLSVEEAIKAQQKRYPNKIVMITVDGARTHMTLEDGRGGYLRKDYLEEKLKSIGKYEKGLLQPEMAKIWKESEEYRSQWSEAEELAERLGALLLHLPNAHPYFNPIECLWRAAKQSYRHNGIRTMAVLYDEIRVYLGQPVTQESQDSQRRWLHYAREIRRHLFHHPEAVHLMENQIRKKKYKLQPLINLGPLKKLLGYSKDGDIDLPMMQRYAHYLNQARIYLGGEGSRFSLSNTAPFDRHKVYPRIRKGNSESKKKSKSNSKSKKSKKKSGEKDDKRESTEYKQAKVPKGRKGQKKRAKTSKDDEIDDAGNDLEDGAESAEHIDAGNRRGSDEFKPAHGIKREIEQSLPPRKNQRRKASSGVTFDILSSDDEEQNPAPTRPPLPPPPVKATGAKKEKSQRRRRAVPTRKKTNVKKRTLPLPSTVIEIEPYEAGGPGGPLIASVAITHEKIRKVVERKGGLLDDDMMNGVIALMQAKTGHGVKLMTTYEFDTLATPADAARKHAAYMRTGALADVHTLIYPCHVNGNHWVVLVAKLDDRSLHLYDSIEEGETFNSRCLLDFLRLLWKAGRGKKDDWNVVAEECMQQINGKDCGIFCLDNIETIIAGRNPADDNRVRAGDGEDAYYRDMARRRKHYGKVLLQETLAPK
jgi:hypothetical protein